MVTGLLTTHTHQGRRGAGAGAEGDRDWETRRTNRNNPARFKMKHRRPAGPSASSVQAQKDKYNPVGPLHCIAPTTGLCQDCLCERDEPRERPTGCRSLSAWPEKDEGRGLVWCLAVRRDFLRADLRADPIVLTHFELECLHTLHKV